MATLHALLVGIDKYLISNYNLRGCTNDLKAFKTYIQQFARNKGYQLNCKVLINDKATRDNIINAFDLFRTIENGDYGVFFFAGHGSWWNSPKEFFHLQPNMKLESLVCYDSRVHGKADILDKELRHLIWEITNGKDLHFLVVTDCCHSASIVRSTSRDSIRTKIRNIDGGALNMSLKSFYGFNYYEKVEQEYSPRMGRYVHLAACRDDQEAKEVVVKGNFRGIFSYCLLETLEYADSTASYQELINRISLEMKKHVKNQSAQLFCTNSFDEKLLFLSRRKYTGRKVYLVSYNQIKGWHINAGLLHGIVPSNGLSKVLFELDKNGQHIVASRIMNLYSIVEGMDSFDKTKNYKAFFIPKEVPKLKVALLVKNTEASLHQYMLSLLKENPSDQFELVHEEDQANYIIHLNAGQLFFTKVIGKVPLFKIERVLNEFTSLRFLNNIEKTIRWQNVISLSNKNTSIREDEIEISLYKTTTPGAYFDHSSKEIVNWQKPIDLYYQYGNTGRWYKPGFQFKVKNTGERTLWFSLLFLGDDFSITNQLLPKQQLKPGEESWAFSRDNNGKVFRTNIIQIDNACHESRNGIAFEYLKLFICSDEFDTSYLNQEGMIFDDEFSSINYRSLVKIGQIYQVDWMVKNIKLKVIAPFDASINNN